MVTRAGLPNEDLEFVQFHPTGIIFLLPFNIPKNQRVIRVKCVQNNAFTS